MKNSLLYLLLATLVSWGCGSSIKGTADGDEDTTTDTSDTDGTTDTDEDPSGDPTTDSEEDPTTDTPTDTPTDGPCTDGTMRCSSDGTALEECVDSAWTSTECEYGCSEDGGAHCLVWDISNIPDDSMLEAGDTPTGDPWPSDSSDTYWVDMNTDNGQMDVYRWAGDHWAHVAELRPADLGLDAGSGIAFQVVEQGTDLPDLGVFSFQRLDVPENYTLGIWGTLPMVLLSEEDATIDGGVYVGCSWTEGPPLGGAADSGEGPGAGGDGSPMGGPSGDRDGGGGGGAYGGPGGTGGGYDPSLRGTGGTPYGTAELVPLIGGSGGGFGSDTGGGYGGRSGGAVQIVSGGTLSISGWVDSGGCGGFPAWESNEAGGGGGSGGGILLEAPGLNITGSATANGGGGAGGGPRWDGDFGEDGLIADDTAAAGGATSSPYCCAGGDGNGAGGDAGVDAPACDSDPGLYNAGGGGGGGGILRLNSMTGDISTCLLSPGLSAASVTEGALPLI